MISVSSAVKDKKLILFAKVSTATNNTEYAIYVYDEKKQIICKTKYQKEPEFVVDVEEKETYYVRVFVRTLPYHTEAKLCGPFYIFSKKETEEYNSFLKTEPTPLGFPLPFHKQSEPFQDILLSYITLSKFAKANQKIKDISDELEMYHEEISNGKDSMILMTTKPALKTDKGMIAFSGMGKADDRLIIGIDELDTINTAEKMEDEIGEWCMVRANEKEVFIDTDYFGIQRIYYYKGNDIFLCSNRVHLLLHAMEKIGIPKIPNKRKINTYLSINNQIFMQNFSSELNVHGVYALPIDSRIRIDLEKNKICFEKTELYNTLSVPLMYDEQIYKDLLYKAVNELIENCRIALEHPKLHKFIVHVTGGLDSRVVLCALSKFPEYKDKVICHTALSKNQIKDYETAIKVVANSPFSYGVPYYSDNASNNFSELQALSSILGITSEFPVYGGRKYAGMCTFSGFYGEITGRAYYTANSFDSALADSTLSNEEFCQMVVRAKYLNPIFDASEEMAEELQKDMISIPGRTNFERLENHYLYYRNGLHCESTWRTNSEGIYWGPLQSKTLMKLKYMCFPHNVGIKLELDVMYMLNPTIAGLDFAAEKNESARSKLNKNGKYPKTDIDDGKKISRTKAQWQKAVDEKKKATVVKEKLKPVFSDTNALLVLRRLIEDSILRNEDAMMLWHYINNSNDSRKKFLYHKIISLYFELYEE